MRKDNGYRLFKTTYKDRQGQTQEAAKWYVEFSDQREKTRRLPAFTSKAASEEMGRSLVALVAYHKATGGQTDPALQPWLTGLPSQTREKLVRIGLLDRERVAVGKPLSEHVDDWANALSAKGNTAFHVDVVTGRARRIIDGCGFKFFPDVKASKVQSFIHDLRRGTDEKAGISAQTFNFYLASLKQFCRWMLKDRRATENPVAHLDGLNVKTDRRRDRRTLRPEELHQLLDSARSGPERSGLTGPARALLYRLALETGLRANELRSLTRASFGLDTEAPTVTVEAGYSKHRRRDTLPLRPDLAAELRAFLALHAPGAPAFRMLDRKAMGKLFRADVETAGLPYRDADGRVFDFHALRHQFITHLAKAGVHPKTAQALARHSTIALTMDRYTHTVREELSDAVLCLPDLTRPAAAAVRATGTDGPARRTGAIQNAGDSVLADCLSLPGHFQGASGGAHGRGDGVTLQSQSPENIAVYAMNQASGSVCTAGAGPGLQNQRTV